MTPEVERLERLAERLRAVDPVLPEPGAKIRGWNLVLAEVQRSASDRSRRHPVRRLALAGFAAAALLVAGAVGAAADSLPDSPLYPLKGAVESARGALIFGPSDRLTYHLELARTRLMEAQAMIARHRLELADKALNGLDDELNEAALVVQAEKQSDPTVAAGMETRLRQAIATHDRQLAGLQGNVTNPTAVSAISKARDRAAAALQVAAQPASNNGKNGKASPSPKQSGRGSPASGSASPGQTP
jgi:uncharacterized protein DUF5667